MSVSHWSIRAVAIGLCVVVLRAFPAPAEEPKPEAAATPAAATPAAAIEAAPASTDALLPGHSQHGEAFNEGPRQAAYRMGGTGRVSFPITTKAADGQVFFDQGVGQLHGFWYFEAERTFRQLASLDADCAMAYWGMAMANINNKDRARKFIAEAVKRREQASSREQKWIDALSAYYDEAKKSDNKERRRQYVRALEAIIHEQPDDIEAKAFLALAIWQNSSEGLPLTSHQAVDAILDQVFAANPAHPAHHYRIHLWDKEKPARALASAAACGPAAPEIAHMWHMPGHIYWGLRRYRDAAWQHEASARVDHAHMIEDRILPDQIHNYSHNNEWLIRDLVRVGRARDAVDLAQNMIDLPRHPKYNGVSKRNTSASYGRQRLFEVLVEYEMWPELIALADTSSLEPTHVKAEQIKRLRYLGAAYFATGDAERGGQVLAELEDRLAKAKGTAGDSEKEEPQPDAESTDEQSKDAAADKPADVAAEPKPEGENKEAADTEEKSDADDKKDTAEKKDEEEKKPSGDRVKPLEQAIAYIHGHQELAAESAKQALAHFDNAGSVDKAFLSRVHLRAGDAAKAEDLARGAVKSGQDEVRPLANLIYVLRGCEKTLEVRKEFETLRRLACDANLDVAPFVRLAAIADELDYPEDWRLPAVSATDLGERPPLDTLGPLRWQPSPAPAWMLADVDGRKVSMEDFRGRPVLVVLYLGFGCLHCAEQIAKLEPLTAEFGKEGISIVAISSETPEQLRSALAARDAATPFPFQLLPDPTLEAFRAFRAYDDFEHAPLHATFLIDAAGLVRWQDINYEPFVNFDFLLPEARRLLGQGTASNAQR